MHCFHCRFVFAWVSAFCTVSSAFVLPTSTPVAHRVPKSSLQDITSIQRTESVLLFGTASPKDVEDMNSNNNKPLFQFLLDPGTKGGAIFLSLVLFLVPISLYNLVTTVGGVDNIQAGVFIGVGFTSVATLAWLLSLVYRVVTKDMTYVRILLPPLYIKCTQSHNTQTKHV